jgi:hypothetical protein
MKTVGSHEQRTGNGRKGRGAFYLGRIGHCKCCPNNSATGGFRCAIEDQQRNPVPGSRSQREKWTVQVLAERRVGVVIPDGDDIPEAIAPAVF